jgi:hypothetical protein
MTFGMGDNHGGTSLTIDKAPDTTDHAAPEHYIPIDKYDEAVAEAIRVAKNRGDDKSVESIRKIKPSLVVDPTLATNSWRPARRTLQNTYDLNSEILPVNSPFRGYRSIGATENVDDGWGCHKRVNCSADGIPNTSLQGIFKFGAEHGPL